MSYTKQIWENLPSTNSPLSADRLNHMEDGIYDANEGLVEITDSYSTSTVNGYSCNYVNGLTTYSTTESVVGFWINGKPIYRKVIISNSISSDISTGISNYEDVVKLQMLVKQTGSNSWRNIPWLFASGSNIGSGEWAGGFYFSNGEIKNQVGTSLKDISRCIVILEYTKTSN